MKSGGTSMARVAAYLRRSSPGEEDKNYSIETQLDDIQNWAARNGHTVEQTYSDPGGRSYTLNRPVLQQMLADARQGKFDVVCVGRYDRFSRVQKQATVATWMLKEHGVQVASATQPVPDGAVGTMLKNSYAFAAELELENIRARTYAGKKARVHSGKLPPMGRPKYGYQFADDKRERYVPHPETADVVQRIFSLSASGQTIRGICKLLNDEGVTTPSQQLVRDGYAPTYKQASAGWRTKVIHNILTDTAYAGRLVGFGTKVEYGTRKNPVTGEMVPVRKVTKRSADDPNVYHYSADVCPPLVDEDLFQAVQARLKLNQQEAPRNIRHPEALLLRSGIARCGYCGRALSVTHGQQWGGEGKYSYLCTARNRREGVCTSPTHLLITAEKLDAACWEWFTRQLMQPARLREMYETYTRNADAVAVASAEASEMKATRAAMTEAQEQEASYLAAVGSARTNDMRERFVGLAEDAHSRALSLAQTLEQLEAKTFNQKQQRAMLETFSKASERAAAKLQDASIEDKRQALRIFNVVARLWARDHTPRFAFTWLGGIDPETSVSVTNQV